MWKIRFSDFAYKFNELHLASYQDEFVIKNITFHEIRF